MPQLVLHYLLYPRVRVRVTRVCACTRVRARLRLPSARAVVGSSPVAQRRTGLQLLDVLHLVSFGGNGHISKITQDCFPVKPLKQTIHERRRLATTWSAWA